MDRQVRYAGNPLGKLLAGFKVNKLETHWRTVSGLVLATANDEIPDICLSFSPKITRKKIGGMKYLIIKILDSV